MIWLDNAATTLKKPPCVAEAVCAALAGGTGNPARGVNEGSLAAARSVYEARERLARLLHVASPNRVAFASGATEALNTAILGLFGAGDHVIASDCAHNSVLRPLHVLETLGGSVSFVPADSRGVEDLCAYEKLLTPRTRGIVATAASNLTGNPADLDFLSDFAKKHGLLLVVDAAQAAGERELDFEMLGASALCFTGHKALMGPQGTGGIAVSEGLPIRPLKTGGTGTDTFSALQPAAFPDRLEAGTLNCHGIAGLSAAAEFLLGTGLAEVEQKLAALSRYFVEAVRDIPGIVLYGDLTLPRRAPVVCLNLAGHGSDEVGFALSERFGICVRAGGHCAPRLHRALGTAKTGAVRFSFSIYTEYRELDAAAAALRTLSEELR